MNRQRKILILSILVVILLLIGILSATKLSRVHQIRRIGTEFITSLSSGDTQKAKQYADGEVSFRLNNTAIKTKAQVVKSEILIAQSNNKWARVMAQVDLILADGSYDVGWYELDMYNKNGWRVIKLKESTPMMVEQTIMFNQTQDLKNSLDGYFKLLNEGNYTLAGQKYLAGPARKAQEQTVKNYALKGKPKNLMIEPLYGNKEIMAARVQYILNDRKVSTIITFYKTDEQWKIVEIVPAS